MPEFILSQAARLDIYAVCEYFDAESGNLELGDKFSNAALRTFEKLAKTPGWDDLENSKNGRVKISVPGEWTAFPTAWFFINPVPMELKLCG